MIYTIVPAEQVYSVVSEQSPAISDGTDEKHSVRAKYMDEDVLLSQSKTGEYSIEKLISTNPKSYLKKEFFPGASADIKKISFE